VEPTRTKRCEDFAKKLDLDNMLEAFLSALSNAPQHPCGCYEDSHNNIHPSFLPVMTFSIFVKIDGIVYRLASIIGCSKKEIQEYYEQRLKPDAILINEIQTVIRGLPAS
jgi:hypothetical protein